MNHYFQKTLLNNTLFIIIILCGFWKFKHQTLKNNL